MVYSTCSISPGELSFACSTALSACANKVSAFAEIWTLLLLVLPACAAAENEANVAWLLKAYPEMELSRHFPVLGQHGLSGQLRHQNGDLEDWLTTSQAERVQRFDPTAALDTIGFFIAKFTKS